MWYRARQVWSALKAKVLPEERQWIETLLTPQELALYDTMDVVDQRHTLDVAYTCRDLSRDWPREEQRFLLRAALLHDIGKTRGDLTVFLRVLAVFLHYLLKDKTATLAHPQKGRWRRALHIYFHHPALGAAKGEAGGVPPEILRLIARHHQPPDAEDDKFLQALKEADGRN